eukprot:364820-Chlamydomonas_euryale.AAC.3
MQETGVCGSWDGQTMRKAGVCGSWDGQTMRETGVYGSWDGQTRASVHASVCASAHPVLAVAAVVVRVSVPRVSAVIAPTIHVSTPLESSPSQQSVACPRPSSPRCRSSGDAHGSNPRPRCGGRTCHAGHVRHMSWSLQTSPPLNNDETGSTDSGPRAGCAAREGSTLFLANPDSGPLVHDNGVGGTDGGACAGRSTREGDMQAMASARERGPAHTRDRPPQAGCLLSLFNALQH